MQRQLLAERIQKISKKYQRTQQIQTIMPIMVDQPIDSKHKIIHIPLISEFLPSLYVNQLRQYQTEQINPPVTAQFKLQQARSWNCGDGQQPKKLELQDQQRPEQNQQHNSQISIESLGYPSSSSHKLVSPKQEVILQQFDQCSSEQCEDSIRSQIDYLPKNDIDYVPIQELNEQINRIVSVIQHFSVYEVSTQTRYELMFQQYKNRGGKKNFYKFQEKIIQDILYLVRYFKQKPKYKKK